MRSTAEGSTAEGSTAEGSTVDDRRPMIERVARAARPRAWAVYSQIIDDALRESMKRALEAWVMERQTEGKAKFPPFAQQIFERGFQDGETKGELKGKREVLLRLLTRAGITLTEEERSRIQACEDGSTLDRWAENVLGAKTAADVLA